MTHSRSSDDDGVSRDILSFIEPRPPLISHPCARIMPQKGRNLLHLFETSESDEPELLQVYLRLKPCKTPTSLYEVRSDRYLITSLDTTTAGHGRRTHHNVSKMYTFSQIFGPDANQKNIFEQVVKDNLKKLPDGNSFTLLTYGASGSGKTFTLMGTVAAPGLVPRSLEYVFKVVDAAQEPAFKPDEHGVVNLNTAKQLYELQWVKKLRQISAPLREKYRRMSVKLSSDFATSSNMDLSNRRRHYVWVSFIEIYNEGIYDLLATGDRKNSPKLAIREDSNGNVYVKSATQAFVRSGEEAYDVMVAGKHNLQVAATGIHTESSRSHCIFTITMLTETEDGMRSACVRLCDLAGCERAARTRNTGARMHESRAINSSLHVLERCLRTLRRKRTAASIVPYRESKLTRLLGAGLSGTRGEAVSMVVTVNPSPEYANETKHVLQLAAVAKDIQINNTMLDYPSTLESSTQDSTIGYNSTEIMALRADNERLHYELIQSQYRVDELTARMDKRQAANADEVRKYVEEAKEITKDYYEYLLTSMKAEMKEMAEEYESKLLEASANVSQKGITSEAEQDQISQLSTEIALLKEQLSAERLARARLEEEVQHLRACIDERDEKVDEDIDMMDNVSVSDNDESDNESELWNVSLEPTIKREDINRSKIIRKSILSDVINLDDTIESNDIEEKSNDTLKDNDIINDVSECINTSNKEENITQDINKYEVTDEIASKSTDFKINYRNTYFVNPINDFQEKEPTETQIPLSRKTYCLTISQDLSDSNAKRENRVQKLVDEDIGKNDKDVVLNAESKDEIDEQPRAFIKNLLSSVKQSSESNNSLLQFERLELETKMFDKHTERMTGAFSNIIKEKTILLKENRKYFDDDDINNKNLSSVTPCTVPKKTNKIIYSDDPEEQEQFRHEKTITVDDSEEEKGCIRNKDVTELKSEIAIIKLTDVTDAYQSPSIVKEDEANNYDANRDEKLIEKSDTRQDKGPCAITKLKISLKSHHSLDVFGDSPICSDKYEEIDLPKSIENTVQDFDRCDKIRSSYNSPNTIIDSNNSKTNKNSCEETKERKLMKREIDKSYTEVVDKNYIGNENLDADDKEIPQDKPLDILVDSVSQLRVNCTEVDDTLVEFENIYKNITVPRATEFDLLITQEIEDASIKDNQNTKDNSETDDSRYNFRKKLRLETRKKVIKDETLIQSSAKCESKSKTRRNLRLRRQKHISDEDVEVESKLKDIVNLQTEFSDVTMDVPAPIKDTKDIPSPEKVENKENSSALGAQSCPAKSILRSQRKLFTPRAEPLEESSGQTGDSNERLYVPRPSYLRPRARRKL